MLINEYKHCLYFSFTSLATRSFFYLHIIYQEGLIRIKLFFFFSKCVIAKN